MPDTTKRPEGGSKDGTLKSPVYSSGTKDQLQDNNMGSVQGPKGAKSCPDPLGYKQGA